MTIPMFLQCGVYSSANAYELRADLVISKIIPSWTKVRRGLPLSIGRPYRFSPPPRSTGTTHPKIPLSFHFLVLGHNNHPACRRARGLSLKSAFGCPSSSSKKIISEIIINRICQTTCSNLYSLSFSVLLATTGQAAMWTRRRSRFQFWPRRKQTRFLDIWTAHA